MVGSQELLEFPLSFVRVGLCCYEKVWRGCLSSNLCCYWCHAPRHINSNISRKTGNPFKPSRNNTVRFSRKKGEIRVTPVNQPRPMSIKKPNSIRKKKQKKNEELLQTRLLPIISLITTTMITLVSLSAMQVVTPSQVKFFSTMVTKGILTVFLINNALKIIVLIPPFLQPLQIIHFLLLIKDAVTSF